jgi:hypothetical protein
MGERPMIARITHDLRTHLGIVKRDEVVQVLREQIEVGTHRTIISAARANGQRIVLLPHDVEVIRP